MLENPDFSAPNDTALKAEHYIRLAVSIGTGCQLLHQLQVRSPSPFGSNACAVVLRYWLGLFVGNTDM